MKKNLLTAQLVLVIVAMFACIGIVVVALAEAVEGYQDGFAITFLGLMAIIFASLTIKSRKFSKILFTIIGGAAMIVSLVLAIGSIRSYIDAIEFYYPKWYMLSIIFISLCCLVISILRFIYSFAKSELPKKIYSITTLVFSALLLIQTLLTFVVGFLVKDTISEILNSIIFLVITIVFVVIYLENRKLAIPEEPKSEEQLEKVAEINKEDK